MIGSPVGGESHQPASLWLTAAAVGALSMVVATFSAISSWPQPDSILQSLVETPIGSTSDQEIQPAGPGPITPEPASDTGPLQAPIVDDEAETPDDCPPSFTVFFPFGQATPSEADFAVEVQQMAQWLGAHLDAVLLVEGHADSAGSEEANLALSFRRAEWVAGLMAEAGVAARQINPRGFGEYQQVSGEPPDSERNRRVTMTVTGFESCESRQ